MAEPSESPGPGSAPGPVPGSYKETPLPQDPRTRKNTKNNDRPFKVFIKRTSKTFFSQKPFEKLAWLNVHYNQ
jgi:hypothetical protein